MEYDEEGEPKKPKLQTNIRGCVLNREISESESSVDPKAAGGSDMPKGHTFSEVVHYRAFSVPHVCGQGDFQMSWDADSAW